jgi:hypothetical protein
VDVEQERQDFIGYGLASIIERQVRAKVAAEIVDYMVEHEQGNCCNDLGDRLWLLARDGA